MKQRYWLFRRGATFYLQDSESGKKESLHTSDKKQASRLRDARNEAAERPLVGLTLGRAYLAAYDPKLTERTWGQVMDEYCQQGKASTRDRRVRGLKAKAFEKLRTRKLVDTTADELRAIMAGGGVFLHHFVHCLHNMAVGFGWLPWAIIPPKLWPKVHTKSKRGITEAEFRRIIESEQNTERRHYYELLWEIGAAQTDAVELTNENIDWTTRVLSYQRRKTGEWAQLMIGSRLETLLRKLPASGPLFPHLRTTNPSARAAEFCRRCRVVGIKGVSLHSFRYAWAERAKAAGYPERFAQAALGHNSKAVHRAYAKAAHVMLPPLEDYEAAKHLIKVLPAPTAETKAA